MEWPEKYFFFFASRGSRGLPLMNIERYNRVSSCSKSIQGNINIKLLKEEGKGLQEPSSSSHPVFSVVTAYLLCYLI